MGKRENCVYCGKLIIKRSREHIIQNALGGLYESEDICCPECNNYISKYIDAPFTKTFNPIISRIDNFTKTNNKKSQPLCTGKAIYNETIYNVSIKRSKVVACPELSRQLKCDISKLNFEIVAYDFPIDNTAFKNGMLKIAFNFALDKGIDIDILLNGVKIETRDNKMDSISFEYPLIPFVPLNPLDKHIELNTDIELYHNLILFSQENRLWCYIDLFNTFQYYVLLSEEWYENVSIHETYLQLLQKIDRTIPKLHIRKPKHILTYAMLYNIEPCLDLDVFRKRVTEAIQKESLKKSMSDIVSPKIRSKYLTPENLTQTSQDELFFRLMSFLVYSNEDDSLNESNYRIVTPTGNDHEIVSYPLFISMLIRDGIIDVCSYRYGKFERLNKLLAGFDNIENAMSDDEFI